MAYSIYNTQCFVSARVDEEEGTISFRLAHLDQPFVINKEDELYDYHLKNVQMSKEQIKAAYPLEAKTETPKPSPLRGL